MTTQTWTFAVQGIWLLDLFRLQGGASTYRRLQLGLVGMQIQNLFSLRIQSPDAKPKSVLAVGAKQAKR